MRHPLIGSIASSRSAGGIGFDLTDLQAWWDFESDGTDSHNSNDLVDENGTPTYASGHIGNACVLTQAPYTSYSAPSNAGLQITGDFTVGQWVNQSNLNPGTNKGLTGKPGSWVLLTSANSGKFVCLTNGGGNSGVTTTVTSVGVWYFVVGVYKASTHVQCWVNGVKEAEQTVGVPASLAGSTDDMTMNDNVGAGIVGGFDSGFVASRAYSEAEILTLYNSGAGRSYLDLL